MNQSERHGRLGSQKTTTGCRTCKKRRVKCDEAKPVCMRCTKADRECLGYAPWQTIPYRPQRYAEVYFPCSYPSQSMLNMYQSEEEYRSFQFFAHNASKQMGSIPDEDFWTQLVPQLSFSNPAVRYAAIAIGSLFHNRCESMPTNSSRPSLLTNDNDKRFALQYYNKALNATVVGMATSQDAQTALITCILFFCMEALQGHEVQALSLYYQGQTLLNKVVDQKPEWQDLASTSNPLSVHGRLCLIFSRLRILAALFGEQRPECFVYKNEHQSTSVTLLDPFNTTSNAIAGLSDLMADIHQFIVRASRQKWLLEEDSEMYQALEREQLGLLAGLQMWRVRFRPLAHLLEAPLPSTQASTIAAIALIQCDEVVISLWLSCALCKPECAYDTELESFRRAISLASRVIDFTCAQHDGARPVFQFELGVIAPLYWVIAKCRDPTTRRMALDLLRKAPEQEGLWDCRKTIMTAKRVIEVEEEGLTPGQWPAEEARVHDTQNELDSLDGNMRQYSCLFMRKPFGLDSDWVVWREQKEVADNSP